MAIAKFVSFVSAPRFQHDCNKCRFLGILNGDDLYTCEGVGGKTYILRHGHEDSNNSAMEEHAIPYFPEGHPYRLAVKLAELGKPPAMYETR